MNERTQIAIKLISSHIVLIIGLIVISFFIKNEAFLFLTVTQTALLILYFAGYWEFFGLNFKKFYVTISECLILVVFIWKLLSNQENEINEYLIVPLSLVQVYLLFELMKILIVKYKRDNSGLEIDFPFGQGRYLITDGGNSRISRMMNYHYYSPTHRKNKTNNSMLYATDMVKIENGPFSFLPKKNEDNPIFNENIYSPIAGVVVKVENNIPDNKPFAGNYPYNTGNTVVIQNKNRYMLLGHLKKGSIVVKEGDVINAKDLIGLAGNSGWTERPHLHMQLMESDSNNYWFGKGVGIRYRNKSLHKNKLIICNP